VRKPCVVSPPTLTEDNSCATASFARQFKNVSAVFDFRAQSCHSALMDASGLKLRATSRKAKAISYQSS
jgi:hypothetical protein